MNEPAYGLLPARSRVFTSARMSVSREDLLVLGLEPDDALGLRMRGRRLVLELVEGAATRSPRGPADVRLSPEATQERTF